MLGQDSRLIAVGPPGCIGCPCALGRREAPLAHATSDGRLVQAALLAFGAPLLLLLLSAVGAAAFAANQPLWALAGLASLPGIAAFRRFPITSYTSTRND